MIEPGTIVRRKWGTQRYEVLRQTPMPGLKQAGYLLKALGESWVKEVRELEINLVVVNEDEPERSEITQR